MSGIGFQKLNGQGTIAFSQLEKLQEINAGINDLKNKILTPDLRAWFKILFPALPVIPYYKTFRMIDPEDATTAQPIGKKVFAEIFMHATLDRVSATNNTYAGIKVQALLGATVIHQVSAMVHGNDILSLPSQSSSFVGVIDSYWFAKHGSSLLEGDGSIVIRGFVIPDNYDVNELTALQEIPESIGTDTVIEFVNMPTIKRLNINDVPNGIDYDNPQLEGISQYELYYVEGANFLQPGTDYVNKATGGFTLTGFSPLLIDQTILMIF